MNNRLMAAMACYLVLGLLAAATLEGLLRAVVWIFLGGLGVKTWIAHAARR